MSGFFFFFKRKLLPAFKGGELKRISSLSRVLRDGIVFYYFIIKYIMNHSENSSVDRYYRNIISPASLSDHYV